MVTVVPALSTAQEQLPCKVDVKHSINKTSVTFYRAYIDRWARRWRNKTLVGQFRFWTNSSDGGYDSMNLKSTRGVGAGEEAIHYQSGDNKCAVFFVMGHVGSTIQPTYELRVKQPSINVAMYTDCWKEFLNVTVGRRRRPFYHKKCQKAFDPNEDRIRYL
ncbi:hypothetical protein V5799_018615 [Amblyomma americanum]|uniref:Lipocalin n=1 Tax=Amblyomma americanum TaxID=6943 RepID=A0AAQ4EYX8_AMBAM